jgi:hypothetical protein
MRITVTKDELKEYEKLKIISQLTPLKEKIRLFESKYKCSFEQFEKKINEEQENFGKWDDYIEWKAYIETFKDLTTKLKEAEDATDIKVA